MAVQRVLGAAWALVHGPSGSEALLRWLLEARFSGLVPGPAPRSCDWAALARAARNYPVAFPAVRVHSVLADQPASGGLASPQPREREQALESVQRAVATAGSVGTDRVILDLGPVPLLGEVGREDLAETGWRREDVQALAARRKAGLEPALDRVCRQLHAICKSNPETWFCLTAGRSLRGVAGLDALASIFEDLPTARLRYWHDTAVAARREQLLGEAQGHWLEEFSNRLSGITLGDATDDGMYLPPGSGGVDYPLLGAYLPRAGKGTTACLELDPAVRAAELPGVRSCLDKFGL